MRMVEIPCEDKEKFDKLRERVLEEFPFGLLNSEYSVIQKKAFLYFWDTDYIPPEWEEYIIRPVSKRNKEEGISEEYE